MRNTLIIMQRELRSYFVSGIAYVVTALFLVVCGALFYAVLKLTREATLNYFFHNGAVTLLLITPAITMRLIAEERRSGTIELLMTSPVTEAQVVLGKYLGALVFWAVMLVLTLQYPVILLRLGTPDKGPMMTGYLGLFLLGASFLAIGLVASALSRNQINACIGAFVAMLLLWIIAWVSGGGSTSPWAEFLRELSLLTRFENFTKGLVDTRDLLFFVSLIGFCLFLSVRVVATTKAR